MGARAANGNALQPSLVRVLWVSVPPAFRKVSSREFDIAVIGTMWSLQFSDALMPICLPDLSASDTNLRELDSDTYNTGRTRLICH